MTYHRHGIDEPQEVVLEEGHVTANDSPAEHKTHTHTLPHCLHYLVSNQHTPNTRARLTPQ